MIPVYILTNDKHLWLLRGFAYLWNQFYSPEYQVVIFGYNPPDFNLPANFQFHSIGPDNAPIGEWSNGLIKMCQCIMHTHFVLMLEDYWLTAPCDPKAVERLYEVLAKDDVLYINLNGNRAAYRQARPTGEIVGGKQIVRTPKRTPYQMSFQSAIWNRERMLEVLRPGEDPWTAEIEGSKRVDASGLKVLGTRPAVMQYTPIYRARTGKLNLKGVPDIVYMKEQGWLDH